MNSSSIDASATAATQREGRPLAIARETYVVGLGIASAIPSPPAPPTIATAQSCMPPKYGQGDDSTWRLPVFGEERLRYSSSELGTVEAAAVGGPPVVAFTSSPDGVATAARSPNVPHLADHDPVTQLGPGAASRVPPGRRRRPNFAEKLHALLGDPDCRRAATWLPSGRSFVIVDREALVRRILPRYFREAKFESFFRRMRRWGFRKIYTNGVDQIVMSHDLFHRDRPELCKIMNGREGPGASEYARTSSGGTPDDGAAPWKLGWDVSSTLQSCVRAATTRTPIAAKNAPSPPNDAVWAMVTRPVQSRRTMSSSKAAELLLARLSGGIADCEGQLRALKRLRELKERRSRLTGTGGRRGGYPPSA